MPSIVPATEEDKRLFEKSTGYCVGEHFRGIKAVSPNGVLLGMVGFDHWTPASVQIHVWIDSPLALKGYALIKESLRYAFVQAGKKLIVGVTPSNLPKALKFNAHIGFKQIAVIRDGWDVGVDMIITEMRPDSCRWL
jgi:hypothetical protein